MKRRGFIFTLDAILALLLVTMFVVSITQINPSTQVYSTYMRSQSKYVADDTLTMFRTLPLRELVPPETLKEWMTGPDPVINTTLVTPDMSPIDIVATYWATAPLFPGANLTHKAEIIMGYLLNNTLRGYNYELMINNYTSPYLRKVGSNYSAAQDVTPATLILSGYAFNQTPRGYMARAFLNKLGSKENIYTIRGGYIYAETNYPDDAVVIKYIVPADAIPKDAQIEEIKWFVEPAWVGSYYDLYLNGQYITSDYVTYNQLFTDSDYPELKQYFHPGETNVFEVRVYKQWYDGGEDGAQYISIKYRTSVPSTLKFPKKFYFEDVTANYPITNWKFLIIPGALKALNIQVAVGNISATEPISLSFVFTNEVSIPPTYCSYNTTTQVKTCYWSNSTIANTLSANGYNYNQISGKWTTVIVHAGGNWYHSPRIHLIGNESFIEADYTTGILLTAYTIDITEPIPLPNTGWTHNININFNVPEGVQPLWVKFQFPWLYSSGSNPSQRLQVDNPMISPTYLYCHNGNGYSSCNPSNPFTHFAQFGYAANSFDYKYDPLPHAISNGLNTVTITLGNGYQLQPLNGHGELTYVIQGFAGYGDVFPALLRPGCSGYNITYYWTGDNLPHYVTAGDSPYCDVTAQDLLNGRDRYAVDDAIIRLFNNLGGDGTQANPILVQLPPTVNIVFVSMGNIPGLFRPITITLRVWRES
ncbi:hydrolase [Thermococcus barossii]|uniref:Hydrolase n=1 Tax=Thermococcus barossii TaxID=54077 RepID=A0A2Z2MB88_9EURY|nr:hydrolase [Thermococcus barossii]ASJ03860.1 hydrolase [Thermococcus barossii]